MSFNEWKSYKLSEIANYTTGKLNSNAAVKNGKYPFFTCSPQTLQIDNYSFNQDAVILAGNNANGVFAIKHYNGKFNAYQRTYIINTNDAEIVNNKFLYYAIGLQLNNLQRLSVGSATKFLTKPILDNLTIKVPSNLSEMGSIVSILSNLDEKIEVNNKMNKALENMAQAIFKHWFVDFEFPDENGNPYKSNGGKMIDSELGVIPEGWKIKKISEIAKEVVTGKTPSTKDKDNYGSDIPFIKIPDMHGKNFVDETASYLSKQGINKGKLLPEKSICVSCIATPGLVSMNVYKSQTNQQINSIIPTEENRYFLFLNLRSKSNLIKELGSGGSTTLNLNKTEFEKIKLIVPNSIELQNFNHIIDPVMNKLLNFQLENGSLQKIRDALLPKLLSGEIELPIEEEV